MEYNKISEKKRFSIIARAKSFAHAGRGISIFIKSTHNAWIQILYFIVLVVLGCIFTISSSEWIGIIISSSMLLIVEAINTAIEIDINLTSPDFHPYAKDTKDVAAGAVLLTSIMSAVVSSIIFFPYFIKLLN